jgi:hypothetical protein
MRSDDTVKDDIFLWQFLAAAGAKAALLLSLLRLEFPANGWRAPLVVNQLLRDLAPIGEQQFGIVSGKHGKPFANIAQQCSREVQLFGIQIAIGHGFGSRDKFMGIYPAIRGLQPPGRQGQALAGGKRQAV